MKKTSFLFISVLLVNLLNAQSQVLKNGIYLPTKKGGNTILPVASKSIVPMQQPTSTIILVGGKMDPNKMGNLLLPDAPNTDTKNHTYVTNPNFVDLRSTVGTVTTDAPKNSSNKVNNNQNIDVVDNGLTSLTSSNNTGYGSLLDNANEPSLLNKTSSSNTQTGSLLEPLVSTTAPSKSNTNITRNTTQKRMETVDPSLMNLNQKKVSYNNDQPIVTGVPNKIMPPLASIDTKLAGATSKLKMPELAAIDGQTNENTSKSGMPELAPIEGSLDKNDNKSLMPELASIEDENAVKNVQQNIEQPKVKTNLRGFYMPVGTTLNSKNGRSFIFKPAVPVQESEEKKDISEETISTKPSAGGGMGMPALAPIVDEPKKDNSIPALAPIENITKTAETAAMTALTPIRNYTQQQNQQAQPPQNVQYGATKATYQTQQQLLQAAKNHQHDPNNPCCKVQMYNPAAAKKTVAKKPVYRKKRYYRQPQQEIVYVYEDVHQQPVERVETVVYVPTQKQYSRPQSQTYQTQQTQPVQQQVQQVQQPQQKVIYRDYTNQYTKQTPQQQNNCNCPGTTNQQQKTSADGKKYYNPNNYASGLNAGPTSGDYSGSNNSNNVNINYTFYLNPRGKYSVGLYNNYCTFLVSQNGELKEYKINGDPSIDPNSYRPRLNYFGKPENVAGVPIEYNYNRTVHRIGNIKFEYDFEGFFKTVGNSNVFYNSRSSLAKVDDINVQYDANANVTSVDPNNGLIQFNPQ